MTSLGWREVSKPHHNSHIYELYEKIGDEDKTYDN
jgi:hypothetical protein